MCALLNMSVAEKMRPELGQRGAIAVLLSESILSQCMRYCYVYKNVCLKDMGK